MSKRGGWNGNEASRDERQAPADLGSPDQICPRCGAYILADDRSEAAWRELRADRDRLAAELHEARNERRREHELRCRLAGELEAARTEVEQMRADRDRLARECNVHALNCAHLRAELSAARADAERYRWLRDVASAGQWSYLEGCACDALDEQVDKWRAAPSAGAEHD